jgi:hypothetical protein
MVMDCFLLKHIPQEERENWQSQLAFKLCVNGEFLADSQYTVDLDSFFNSIGVRLGLLEFIGGGGVPNCCGEGRNVSATNECWILFDLQDSSCVEYRFTWSDVLESAEKVVQQVEKSLVQLSSAEFTTEQLQKYKEKLEILRTCEG